MIIVIYRVSSSFSLEQTGSRQS